MTVLVTGQTRDGHRAAQVATLSVGRGAGGRPPGAAGGRWQVVPGVTRNRAPAYIGLPVTSPAGSSSPSSPRHEEIARTAPGSTAGLAGSSDGW